MYIALKIVKDTGLTTKKSNINLSVLAKAPLQENCKNNLPLPSLKKNHNVSKK
jgi:hypothetical protein